MENNEVSKENVEQHKSCIIGPYSPKERRNKAYQVREEDAHLKKHVPVSEHSCNHDELLFFKKIANYTKGLPHNLLGEVDIEAYKAYIQTLMTGNPKKFENIPMGGVRKMVNPQSAYAFELVGLDSHQLTISPAPSFSSAQMSGEMVELYWQALTRDVPFTQFETNPLTIAAAAELSKLSDFWGPKINGQITPQTLFRENLQGALVGPYISQFLWKDIPYGATTISQRYRTTVAADDHLSTFQDWLDVQNGSTPPNPNVFDSTLRYIQNGRSLAWYVHECFTVEDGLNACLILLGYGNAALDNSNPYLKSATQVGFATFGDPHILDFVTRASRPALEAAWFQKWLVHRRIRPEEFAGRIHNLLTGAVQYPINSEVLNSEAISLIFKEYGTYLLPQAYAEGCPAHPSYPQGHSTVIGAMVTMLKAYFNESFVIPDPVVPSPDGLSLDAYQGPPLTVGGELNKLASNIALGRNTAGVHYRSDSINGLKLGEAVAISILRDYRNTYNEDFNGFTLTKFDGSTIRI